MTEDNQELLERADRDINDETDQPTSFWQQNIKIARRIIVAVVGTTVLLFGIALILLPGPAVIVIPIGLAILATEFAWARHWLKKIRQVTDKVVFWKRKP